MRKSGLKLSLALVAIICYASMILIQHYLERASRVALMDPDRPVSFPKPSLVKSASLKHHTLTADFYWFKAIQYLGNCLNYQIKPFQLWRYADFITELDPKFLEAYYYPAVVMITDQITPEENVRLLEKGRKNLPDSWEPPYLLGFVYYYFMNEYEKAAENLDLAAKLGGYVPYAIFAARIRAEGGNPDLSISFLEEIINDPKIKAWKSSAEEMVKGVTQRKHLDQLNLLIEEFKARFGSYPSDLEELVKAGLLNSLPLDPMGGIYYLDQKTHQAKSTKEYYTGVYRPKGW